MYPYEQRKAHHAPASPGERELVYVPMPTGTAGSRDALGQFVHPRGTGRVPVQHGTRRWLPETSYENDEYYYGSETVHSNKEAGVPIKEELRSLSPTQKTIKEELSSSVS